MSSNFDCSFDKLGFSSSFDTERFFRSRLLDSERRFFTGERLSLLLEAERSRRPAGDFLDRLRSRLGGDLRPLLFVIERSRRGGERLSRLLDTERSLRGGDLLSRLLSDESRLTGEDFLERLLSRRGGDFLAFLSRERWRLSLERLRLSLERLRLSRTGREFSVDRPRERRAGLELSSFDFSFASFFN